MDIFTNLFRENVSKIVFYAAAQYALIQYNNKQDMFVINEELLKSAIILVVAIIVYNVIVTKFVDTSIFEVPHIRSLVNSYVKWGFYILFEYVAMMAMGETVTEESVKRKVMLFAIAIALNNVIFSSFIESAPLENKYKIIVKDIFDTGVSFIAAEYVLLKFIDNVSDDIIFDSLARLSIPHIGGSLGVVAYDLFMYK